MTTAATVNVTATTTNPPPAGECFANGGNYTCTISLKLPVGILDLYVLAYSGQNGTGVLLAGNVVIAQVNANGTVTQPGSSAPITIALVQKGTLVGTATLGAIGAIVPNGIAKPSVAAPSYPTNSAPYVYSAAGSVAVTNPSNTPIPAGTPIQAVTITDNESSGASCLVYIPNGATTATPCPFATSASSVTLSTSGDSYAVLFNGKFAPAGALTISASFVGASPTPAPISVSITPTIFSTGTVSLSGCCGTVGAIAYDPTGKNIYVGMGNPSTPLRAVPYSSSTGYGTPSAIGVTSVNGSPASNLAGRGVGAIVLGPDGNIWIAEWTGEDEIQYLAVAAINSAVINPTNGATIQPGAGVFAEYALNNTQTQNNNNEGPPLRSIVSMGGFIWLLDKHGDVWRINPTNGLVNPNLGVGYMPGQSSTGALPPTDSTGANFITNDPILYGYVAGIGGKLYFANAETGEFDALTVDTSASPSAGICTPSGPPPCIATFVASLTGQLSSASYGGTSDGTSYYALSSSGAVYKVTPPSTLVTSASVFPNYEGSLGLSPDGWLWTLSPNGVQAIQGMTSSASAVSPASVSACNSSNGLRRGAQGLIVGPDGTFLFSPSNQDQTLASTAVLCAVVY